MLLNFFYLWPDLFAQNRIYIRPSPRYVLTKGKGASRKVRYFYDTETYEKEKNKYKGYEIRYIKGLATLRDYEYEEVISNESNWVHVTIDDPSAFRIMYSENVTERKKLMIASKMGTFCLTGSAHSCILYLSVREKTKRREKYEI
nr:MAG TPA: DNA TOPOISOMERASE IV, B SUBUNIT [Caudoviricetes sp.]